jgi:hypothetical protein
MICLPSDDFCIKNILKLLYHNFRIFHTKSARVTWMFYRFVYKNHQAEAWWFLINL